LKKADDYYSYEEEWEQSGNEKDEEEYKELLMRQFQEVHKQLQLEPLIYFDLERFINDPKAEAFDKKFKKWLNELLQPPVPRVWPKLLIEYIKRNSKYLK
jgi:hypothetical protein